MITEPSNVLLQIINNVAINMLREKNAHYLPKILEESNVKLPGIHYPPVLSYSRTATYLECPEVQGVQCSETVLKKLTDSMNGRLMTVIEKKGDYWSLGFL
uniref:Uncharacterized protein n=1 Tax=Micrurus lemniscatus lemniscatus TaxID=129467 RepID=A0A2D4HAN9_MICLE